VPVGTSVDLHAPRAPDTLLGDLVVGAGFTVDRSSRDRVHATRAVSLPDTVGARMRILVCGLNPSIYAAEHGVAFARGSNRFWKAAVVTGLVDVERDPVAALANGVGMTDLCKRATVASGELSRREYIDGSARVERLVRWLRPPVVLFVGLEGWRAAIDASAAAGEQPRRFGGAVAYVMPSTSGLNARTSLDDLAHHMASANRLAMAGVRSRP
jgi:double-stranded uracil-DNA glycosylase